MASGLPHSMTAIEITAPGGPDVLKPTTRPVPQPGPGEVLIRVEAAGEHALGEALELEVERRAHGDVAGLRV